METPELAKKLLTAFFTSHHKEEVISCVTQDIYACGLASDQEVHNIEEGKTLLASDYYDLFKNYQLHIEDIKSIGDDYALILFQLSHHGINVNYRMSIHTKKENHQNKISHIHVSIVNPKHKVSLFADLSKEKFNKDCQSLLNYAVPGGMFAYYLEEGYPLYFVNKKMIKDLGYQDEKEFYSINDGLLKNVIYPEDIQRIHQDIHQQLIHSDEYKIRYRLLKKDKSYIYVNEIGKKIIGENNKDAIIAVCRDISKEYEEKVFMENVLDSFDSDCAFLAIDFTNQKVKVLDATHGIGRKEGLTREEYICKYKDNGLESIHPDDRPKVWRILSLFINEGISPSLTFRIMKNNNEYTWINASYTRYGQYQGMPVLRVLFTPISIQYDLHLKTLDTDNIGVYVIDRKTRELYYANNAAFTIRGLDVLQYYNKKCYEIFSSCDHKCDDCWLFSQEADDEKEVIRRLKDGKVYSFNIQKSEWNGRDILVVYIKDVTNLYDLKQELQASNDRLNGILKNISCGILICELDHQNIETQYISEGLMSLFEADSLEQFNERYMDVKFFGIDEETIKNNKEKINRLLENGGKDEIISPIETCQGKTIIIQSKITAKKINKHHIKFYVTAFDITDKSLLQKQLQDIMNHVPVGICLYRYNGKDLELISSNRAFSSIFGEEFDSKKMMSHLKNGFFKLVHPDDLQDLKNHLKEASSHEQMDNIHDYRVYSYEKKGYLWISDHVNTYKQLDGTYLLYVTFTDVSDSYKIQQEIIDAKDATAVVIKYGHLGLWTYNIDTKELVQKYHSDKSYGYEIVNKDVPESFIRDGVIHKDDVDGFRKCYLDIINNKARSKCLVRVYNRLTNQYEWARIYLIRQRDMKNNVRKAIAFSIDVNDEIKNIDELSKIQKNLNEANMKFERLLNSVDTGIAVGIYSDLDDSIEIEYMSKGLCDICGVPLDMALNKFNNDVLLGVLPEYKEQVEEAYRHVIKTQEPTNVTYQYHLFREEPVYISMHLTASRIDKHHVNLYGVYSDITQLMKIQEELVLSEITTELSCELARVWTYRYNIDHDTVYIDKSTQEKYHIPAEIKDFTQSLEYNKNLNEDYRHLYIQALNRLKDHDECELVYQAQLSDGKVHWVKTKAKVLENKNYGRIAVVSSQNIDNEKTMEASLKLEREHLHDKEKSLIIYSATDLTDGIILNYKSYVPEVPDHFEDDNYDDMINYFSSTFFQKDRQEYLDSHRKSYLISQKYAGVSEHQYVYQIQLPDKIIWLRLVLKTLLDTSNNHIVVYEYVYNITNEKLIEQFNEMILLERFELCASIDFPNNICYELFIDKETNRPSMLQQDYRQKCTDYVNQYVLEEDRDKYFNNSQKESFFKKDIQSEGSFLYRTVENQKICYKRSNVFYIDEHNCILTRTDVTEIIEKEERVKEELKKNVKLANASTKVKSEFLSRMSYELRTPMNAILAMTSIAKENKTNESQVGECLDKIEASSQYLTALLNDILEMSRIESRTIKLNKNTFKLNELLIGVKTIIEELATQSNVHYEMENHVANDCFYQGDRMRIQQILVNIMTNAIKYTRNEGLVKLSIDRLIDQHHTLLQFNIVDTGIEMSKEMMKHIYEPFHQENDVNISQYQGSGLGLAISKNLIELMNGDIRVDSEEGVGTTFAIDIPIKIVERDFYEEESKVYDVTNLKGIRVLIAEDHPLNVTIAKTLLEKKGVHVTVANNGKKVLDLFNDSHEFYFNAILMDIRMPIMDGFEATKAIRGLSRKDALTIPIIAMTANALHEDRIKSKEAGMNEHLSKPFHPEELYQLLLKTISKENHR